MKETFYRSMNWLHTWVGLVVCWLLFLIFFAGTLSFFKDEITLWNQPAAHMLTGQNAQELQPEQTPSEKQTDLITRSISYLQKEAPHSESWWIYLPNSRNPMLEVAFVDPEKQGRGAWHDHYLDPRSIEQLPDFRDSQGGEFFYRLHFDLHYINSGIARWLVGFASLFMLIALISGVVIHKRIFKDMFNFRANKGSRSWLDVHNISSVLALPFHLMITYTGLITLIFMFFPQPMQVAYNSDFDQFFAEQDPTNKNLDASGVKNPNLDPQLLAQQLQTHWPNISINRITLDNPLDENGIITFYADTGRSFTDDNPRLLLRTNTGELLAKSDIKALEKEPDQITQVHSASETFYDGMIALHTARMAEPVLRWLYFICGIAGCIMIASGCIMWAKRIRERIQPEMASFGLKLVESLNLATLMGLPLATAAFFYSNRLLEINVPERADREILAFFLTWLGVTLLTLYRRDQAAWRLLALLNAVAFAGIPLLSALTTSGNLWLYAVKQQWALLGFELVCLVSALFFALLAARIPAKISLAKKGSKTVESNDAKVENSKAPLASNLVKEQQL